MVFRASPSEYKIDRWEITPPNDSTSVLRAHVSGHPTGLLAAIMNMFGMSRRLDLRLTTEALSLDTSSLSESGRTTAPLNALSSFTAVRTRSLFWPAIFVAGGVAMVLAGLGGGEGGGAVFGLVFVAIGAFWYARSGKLAVNASVSSGVHMGFVFKTGSSGGVRVDEQAAFDLADLATALVLGQKQLNVGDRTGEAALPAWTPEVTSPVGTSGDSTATPEGWYSDPSDATAERFWNGTEWTDQVRTPS